MKEVFINSRNKTAGVYNGGVLNFANQKNNIKGLKRPAPFIFSMKNNSNAVKVNSTISNESNNLNIIEPSIEKESNKEKYIQNSQTYSIKKSKVTNIHEKFNKLVTRKQSISHRGEGFLLKE